MDCKAKVNIFFSQAQATHILMCMKVSLIFECSDMPRFVLIRAESEITTINSPLQFDC